MTEFDWVRHLIAGAVVCLAIHVSEPQASGTAADWKVGLAEVKITPERPVVLLGYGGRKGPFTSVVADIYAKAMALEDSAGHRGVIITMDLVGLQGEIFEPVYQRIREKTSLTRGQLIVNASHSHTGPLISLNPRKEANIAHSALSDEDAANTIAYTCQLQDKLVEVTDRATRHAEPCRLSWGTGEVGFAVNRRLRRPDGVVMAANPEGPVDRTVPVLRVDTPEGKLRAVLFGYACHNTTLTDQHNLISGDYAGFAQTYVQKRYPSAQAMFISGCGADANPHPRGTMEQAESHGACLGQEVCRVLESELRVVHGPLVMEYGYVELPLQVLSREEIQRYSAMNSSQALMARQMLAVLDRGEKLPSYCRGSFGVWQFGTDLTLTALPSESVSGYVALLRQALGPSNLWVAGYNNDYIGYLPTAEIVKEGGHEAIGVTLWVWGPHLDREVGFFAPEVQQRSVDTVRQLAAKAGRKLPQ